MDLTLQGDKAGRNVAITDASGHVSSPRGHLLPHKHCKSLYLAFDAGVLAIRSKHEKPKTQRSGFNTTLAVRASSHLDL